MTATISLLTTGFTGDYFLKPHASDYYIGNEEERGLWFGKGAKRLGLTGSVRPKHFENMLGGNHPWTGKPLLKTSRKKRVPGVDMTFSVPKSVSTFAIAADPGTRRVVIESILESVRQTLSMAEEILPLVRMGKDGVELRRGEIVAGLFPHFTNRTGDPQLHVHAVIGNLTWNGRNRFVGINTMELFDWTRTLGPVFRAFLAEQLRSRLQLDLYLPVDQKGQEQSWFEIRGVSKELCDKWSSRSKEIAEYLSDDLAMGNVTSYSKREANKATRQDKERLPHIDELERRWAEDVRRSGFSAQSVPTVKHQAMSDGIGAAVSKSMQRASDLLLQGNASFTPKQILQIVCEKLQHLGISPRSIIDQVNQQLGNRRSWIHLQGIGWKKSITTPEMWRLEEKMLNHASSLRAMSGGRVSERIIKDILRSKPELSTEQVAVLRDLTQRKNGLRILEGVAGSGKTSVLDSVREAFERSGRSVIGGSLSGLATQNLAEGAQVSSRTVASYLYHLDKPMVQRVVDRILHDLKQLARAAVDKPTYRHKSIAIPKRGVLIIDEAGMIDTRSMERLMYHAKRAKATVILVGDRKQLQPIAAGGPFKFLADKYAHVSLSTNRRQRSEDDRIAVKEVRDGFTKKALESYLRRGLLSVTDSRTDSVKQISQSWVQNGGVSNPKDHMILTETRREARVLNRTCQEARIQAGQLNPESKLEIDGSRFYVGDRILMLKPDRSRGIENGSRGTIVMIDQSKRNVTVLLDHPGKGHPSRVILDFDSLTKDRLTLSYAGTVHKLQGQSTENAYILLGGGMSDNNMAYTQLTRAKGTTRIFVDKSAAGDQLHRIAKRIAVEREKNLAHGHGIIQTPEIDR